MTQYTIITGTFGIPSNAPVGNYSFNVYGGSFIYSKQNAIWINNLNVTSVYPTIWDLSIETPIDLELEIYGSNAFIPSISVPNITRIVLTREDQSISPEYDSISVTFNTIYATFKIPEPIPPNGMYDIEIVQTLPCIRNVDSDLITRSVTLENAIEILTSDDGVT